MDAICKADYDKRVTANKEATEALEKAKQSKQATKEISIPAIGFHEIYGVWFFGRMEGIIMQVGTEQFGVNLNNIMHVVVDIDPKKIDDGIHTITVYGHSCKLYKWVAQGYHRGLVVLEDDMPGNVDAESYRQSGTWSWKL